ncbi:nucleotidyltransferase domain-containing protein [Peribacillus deserti]|uniref:Cyclic GMP-AMP synthase n=1 Tax=Peribacillus deserti TaxID=673318 RepID=A0A2N5M4N0_9BACI|nr:nucleotidyltransferase [Peribacillus deserti]PLT29292.1 nucleotidyltransferase [Peribacillus deserti]
MANLQSDFIQFHNAIKLDYDDNKELRDKRDELLEILDEELPSDAGSYDIFHQGSYAMHTGVKSLDGGDYDIDVGIIFHVSKEDYSNPVTVKKWVYDALCKQYDNVEMKKPCVTVKFESEGADERNYHVDFAIYIDGEDSEETTHHAKGKLHSNADQRCWDEAAPKRLVNTIKNNLSDGDDRKQFRRVIRYMKRWKDIKFRGQVNRPSGIGLTVAGLSHFQSKYTPDLFSNTKTYNDLEALESFVQNMLNKFITMWNQDTGQYEDRLEVHLPTPTYNDIYEKMTVNQMSDFKGKLQTLLEKLKEAKSETDPVEACKFMREEFGDDFPVPDKPTTGEKRGAAIIVDHSSA